MSRSWGHEAFVSVDQAINAWVFAGYADETISARCYRLGVRDLAAGKWGRWRIGQAFVDWLFWPQDLLIRVGTGEWPGVRHCQRAWGAEFARLQLPPEYRP